MIREIKKIENIEKVFIVSRRKSKRVKPEKFWLEDFKTNILAVFANRKNAKEWIDYWENSKDCYEILERKLK